MFLIGNLVNFASKRFLCHSIRTLHLRHAYVLKNSKLPLFECFNLRLYLKAELVFGISSQLRSFGTTTNLCRKADKSKKLKLKHKAEQLSDEDAIRLEVINVKEMLSSFQSLIDYQLAQYRDKLTLRTTPASFNSVVVDTPVGKLPLKNIAQVSQKSANLIVISLTGPDQKYVKNVKEALEKSSLSINLQVDKSAIFVPITKVTREHRENLSKNAKVLFNKTKDHLSKAANKYVKQLKGKEHVGEDTLIAMEAYIEHKEHVFRGDAQAMMEKKQKELLG